MQYVTCCVNIPMCRVGELQDMIDRAQRITYRTARRRIGQALAQVFPDYDWSNRPRHLPMKRDWHVGYYRSVYRGKPVVYVRHSAIEYIFA